MAELIEFSLHLVFGGFVFLGMVYLLSVVFFVSPHE